MGQHVAEQRHVTLVLRPPTFAVARKLGMLLSYEFPTVASLSLSRRMEGE